MDNPNKDSKQITMEDFNHIVPWKVYEKAVVMNEVREKRKDIIIGLLIGLLFLSNALWLWYFSTIEWVDETTSIEAEQDGEGVNIIGGGDVAYGAESDSNSQTENSSGRE